MFEPSTTPRLFGLPPGADFTKQLYQGLIVRMGKHSPEAMAEVEIFVNTQRMQRELRAQFDAGGAMLLPRIRLITDLGLEKALADVPPAVSSLRRRLELVQFISALLEQEPDLAPRAAIYDLADSLASLLSEMHDEDVPPSVLQDLSVPDESGHWERSLKFLQIVERYFGADSVQAPSGEARQRIVAERLTADWKLHPPAHPIIIAGSTGSRGTTALLMRAVAMLPQGAVVLPGFDFDQPASVWERLKPEHGPSDDHPQYRYARLLAQSDVSHSDVEAWSDVPPPCPARARLLSLALRPAPVTDQWRIEGPRFEGLTEATKDMTLIQAPSPRIEATAIALVLRKAAEDGKKSALISPDRLLTRQVTAALSRWGIEPDDSAGEPLSQSAPGRLLRHIAALFGQKLTSEALLILLKHPLVSAGSDLRGMHLLWTRELELWMRRRGPAFPSPNDLRGFAALHKADDGRIAWVEWITGLIFGLEAISRRALSDHLEAHIGLAEALVAGPDCADPQELWSKQAGRKAVEVITTLRNEAPYGGSLNAADYADLFNAVLSRGEVRDPKGPHPDIMIWGTLEARVGGADLVILAGLNDGTWPAAPPPDPWLSRDMRKRTGLTMPEQRVGLSAHDFQQAFGAKEIVLSRSIRDAEAQTVASRWLNRLCNLLAGMSEIGADALGEMIAKGSAWIEMAEALDAPDAMVAPALRPSPRPPVSARPSKLSVTRVERLIRDPYAIYAEAILRLRPLDPLRQTANAPMRGTVLHEVFEQFIARDEPLDPARLMAIADEVLAEQAPWPAARRIWRAKLSRIVDHFLQDEVKRREIGLPLCVEAKGKLTFPELGFDLTATADRIDQTQGGEWIIYDYKTGSPPTINQTKEFSKQLLLEAVIAEAGGFAGVPAGVVYSVEYIGLGANPKNVSISLPPGEVQKIAAELRELISQYQSPSQGYTALRAMQKSTFTGDYEHLARFGEWERSDPAIGEDVG
ncbi:MAG: double-strand break repair protein AddB [Halocynthiibacter sp.]|jgi:ATP-dependent helicase/nuclease subunit B